jgi:hypothetical protein
MRPEDIPSLKVQVFFAHAQRQVLVLPAGSNTELPPSVQHLEWRKVAETTLGDRLLAPASPIVEAELGANGYALLNIVAY